VESFTLGKLFFMSLKVYMTPHRPPRTLAKMLWYLLIMSVPWISDGERQTTSNLQTSNPGAKIRYLYLAKEVGILTEAISKFGKLRHPRRHRRFVKWKSNRSNQEIENQTELTKSNMVEFVSRLPGWSSKQKQQRELSANASENECATNQRGSDDYKHHFKYTKDVCALSWWDPIKLLEEGSISDIHLVRRRKEFVKVRYKEKRDVMSLTKRHRLPWEKSKQKDMGEVYVLKSIMKDHVHDDDVLDEMRQEIHTMSKLDHPNICRLVEAYERRRHVYLVMEYCSGGNLARRAPMDEAQAASVCRKVLSALAYMHSNGVAHRDIKLENIMVTGDGEIKLIDFGLATAYLSDQYNNMTDTVGTLYSMAPEGEQRYLLCGACTFKMNISCTN
jgi:hypothetical protein